MEFLGRSHNIYDNCTNQSSTMNILENCIKCNFREFDYIIAVYVIRYIFQGCIIVEDILTVRLVPKDGLLYCFAL